jgi:hypothetical protein
LSSEEACQDASEAGSAEEEAARQEEGEEIQDLKENCAVHKNTVDTISPPP